MVRKLFQFATLIFLSSATSAQAEVLFEGYSKILSGGKHVGYSVARYEFDPKKKQFRGTTFLKTGGLGVDITESIKAVADQDLNPISYEYTSLMGKKTKSIDAKFSKGKMTAIVKEDGKSVTVRRDLPQGAFLSNFLVYLILRGKNGLQVGTRYDYTAIAEEDAEVSKGDAFIEKQELHRGQNAFRILNRFKDVKFISHVSERGEVISTQSPANGIATELVAVPSEAIGTFGRSDVILQSLFGEVPSGGANVLSRTLSRESTPSAGRKGESVPAGQGIQLKPQESRQ